MHPHDAFQRYGARLIRLFLIWSALYVFVPTNIRRLIEHGWMRVTYWKALELSKDPLRLLLQGSQTHLWFLMALAIGIWILTRLLARGWERALAPIAAALYVGGVLAGSYATTPIGLELGVNTRNGPFSSVPFVALGWWLSSDRARLGPRAALLLAGAGAALHALEVYGLWRYYGVPPFAHDHLLGTVPWALGLMLYLLARPELGRTTALPGLGGHAFGIYASHTMFYVLLSPLRAVVPDLAWQVVRPLLAYGNALALGIALRRHRHLRHIVS